jgi:MFS family permease
MSPRSAAGGGDTGSVRRLILLLYGVIVVAELVLQSVLPLTPTFTARFELSTVEAGWLLAAASVAALVVSIPSGLLADRLGPRRITIAATWLLAGSSLAQGLADDFWVLLLARLGFGFAFGAIWTAGLAWLADSAPPERRSAVLAACMTVAGVGAAAGPAYAGLLAEHVSLGTPFLLTAGAAAAIGAALLLPAAGAGRSEREHVRFLETVRVARRERRILGAAAMMLLAGVVASAVGLLVPLRLGDNGLSSGAIGVAFSVSAGVFTLVSAFVARLGERAVRIHVVAAALVALGASLAIVIASTATPAVLAFVLLRAPCFAILFTLAYPLAATGAHHAGLGRGAILGFLNVTWGFATLVGPLAGGGIAQAAGERVVYGLLVGVCLGAAALLLARPARRALARPEMAG